MENNTEDKAEAWIQPEAGKTSKTSGILLLFLSMGCPSVMLMQCS